MLDCHPCDTHVDPNLKLLLGHGEPLEDPERYHTLISRLNYVNVIRSDIIFVINVVSQFLNDSQWHDVMHIL